MIDLDAIVRRMEYNDYTPGQVSVSESDFFAMVDEIKALRERLLPAPSTPVQPQTTGPSYYRHRLDSNRLVRLLTYNLTTQKYHVEFYDDTGAPRHLNGFIDYAEMQMNYDLHNPIRDFAQEERP